MEFVIEKVFDFDVADVWDVVTDNTDYAWRRDVSIINQVDETRFIEVDHKGYFVEFEITAKVERALYAFDITSANVIGKWKGEFESMADGKCKVTFTEDVETPAFFMKPFLKPFVKKQQALYMEDLNNELIRRSSQNEKVQNKSQPPHI